MRSKIFNLNWEKFNYKDPEQRKQIAGALQYFCALPDQFVPAQFAGIQAFTKVREEIRKMQAFATTADFPPSMLPIIEKYHILPAYDNGYEQIFDVRDFSGSGRDGFTVYGVQSGLTFRRVMVGEKAKVYAMSGDRHSCFFDYYAGALGWHRMLFEDKDWWTIEDNAIQFRNKAYQFRASVFYALIEAVANFKSACISLTTPCDDCTAYARAIACALNTAAETILNNVQNKGYGVSADNTEFIVLTPLHMRGIVRQALSVALQAYAGSERQIDFKFRQITSMMLTNNNRIWVILPKSTLKAGYRMDLTLFSDFDILSYTDTTAGWMRYGGCIGDIEQLECIDGTPPSGINGACE
jgi:hypothetical protein